MQVGSDRRLRLSVSPLARHTGSGWVHGVAMADRSYLARLRTAGGPSHDLLVLLDQHRVMTTGQIARATATPERTVRYRLDRLHEAGLGDCVRPGREQGSAPATTPSISPSATPAPSSTRCRPVPSPWLAGARPATNSYSTGTLSSGTTAPVSTVERHHRQLIGDCRMIRSRWVTRRPTVRPLTPRRSWRRPTPPLRRRIKQGQSLSVGIRRAATHQRDRPLTPNQTAVSRCAASRREQGD